MGQEKEEKKEKKEKEKKEEKKGELGRGTYSKVFQKDEKTAIKKYRNINDEGIAPDLIREVSVLRMFNSKYIIRILEVSHDSIYLPLYEYDLHYCLKHSKPLNIKKFFYGVCRGIYILHSYGIMHRDIKPSNILVKDENSAVLIDLGFARTIEIDRKYNKHTPNVCTLWYRPPEIIEGKKYSFEADVWSAGCVLSEIILKQNVFNKDKEYEILDAQCKLLGTPDNYFKHFNVKKYKGNFDEVFHIESKDCKELLKKMLTINHKQRVGITECLNCKYFVLKKKFKDSMLNYDEYLDKFALSELSNIFRLGNTLIKTRKMLLLWVQDICNKYDLPKKVYFRFVVILDKFLLANEIYEIDMDNFQLVVLGCFWIASKLEDINHLTLEELLFYSNNKYYAKDLEDIEKTILSETSFDLITPILWNYIPIFVKEMQIENKKQFKKYLYYCTLSPESYKYPLSDLACICGFLSKGKKIEREEPLISNLTEIEKDAVLQYQEKILDWAV